MLKYKDFISKIWEKKLSKDGGSGICARFEKKMADSSQLIRSLILTWENVSFFAGFTEEKLD